MTSRPKVIAFAGAWALLFGGCSHQFSGQPEATSSSTLPHQQSVIDDAKAAELANAFLGEQALSWGLPTQILRTVSQWYRIEYARDKSGRERVVLVNPADGQPEFPLPR